MREIATGSGITRRTVNVIDGPLSQAEFEWFKARTGSAQVGVAKRIYDAACKTLADAGLPVCPAVRYRKNKPEKWRRMPMLEAMPADMPDTPFLRKWCGDRVYCWGLASGAIELLAFLPAYIIDVRGYECDSREGYAARLIDCLHNLRLAKECEDMRAIFASAYEMGLLAKEASFKHTWEPLALAAESSRLGASEGGTKDQQRAKKSGTRTSNAHKKAPSAY